jgi:glycosyltransferase involved in cell wall biosynthesis
MKISVIIPIYNVGLYLKEALDSIVGQTYHDVEIICINDGSTDNSLEIIREYEKKDTRIKLVSQENRGLYATRQVGIKMASGDYILFMDGDDWLEKCACEKVAALAEKTHADIIQYGLVTEAPDPESADVKWFNRWFNVTIDCIEGAEDMLACCYERREIPWNIATKAIKTEIVKEAVRHQDSLPINHLEDFLACFFIFFFSKKWVRLDSRLYHYRYGTGMSTKEKVTMEHFESSLTYFQGLRMLQRFVASRQVTPVIQNLAQKVIPQYMMDDALHFAIHRLDANEDSRKWADVLAHAAGTEETLHALASKIACYHAEHVEHAELVRCQSEIQSLTQQVLYVQKKRSKYQKLFKLMALISLLLLVGLLVSYSCCMS